MPRNAALMTDEMWAAYEREMIATRLGLPWSEDDGYEGNSVQNEQLRRAFRRKGCVP